MQQAMEAGEDYFVIGGASMYEAFLPLADSLYLTEIDEAFDGADTFFPAWKKDEWEEQSRELHRPDGREKYPFLSSTMSAVSIDIVNPLCYTKGRATR